MTHKYMDVIETADYLRVYVIGELHYRDSDGNSCRAESILVVAGDAGKTLLFCEHCGCTFSMKYNKCPNCEAQAAGGEPPCDMCGETFTHKKDCPFLNPVQAEDAHLEAQFEDAISGTCEAAGPLEGEY